MMSALGEVGRLGMVAVGESPQEARTAMNRKNNLKNFLGVRIEGPTRVGHYFAPQYASAQGEAARKTLHDLFLFS